MPWNVSASMNLCTQRHAQLTKVIEWINRGRSCGSVDGGAWLVPQFLSDGNTWRGVLWHTSPDAISRIHVRPPDAMGPVRRAVQCDAEGTMTEAAVEGNDLVLLKPLRHWEWVVLNPA